MTLIFNKKIKIANKWLFLFGKKNRKPIINEQTEKKSYESHDYNLPKELLQINWTKVKASQLLAYAALSDDVGNIGIIDLEELAEYIGCSIRSLVNNNDQFMELNLIKVEKLYGTLVDVHFVKYQEDILDLIPVDNTESTNQSEKNQTKKTYGNGYTIIHRELLLELFKLSNINEFRIACLALRFHEKEVNLEKNEQVLLSSEFLKSCLPRYCSFMPSIKRCMKRIQFLFNIKIHTSSLKREIIPEERNKQRRHLDKFKSRFILSLQLHSSLDSRKIEHDEDSGESWFNISAKLRTVIQKTKMVYFSTLDMSETLLNKYGKRVLTTAFNDIIAYFEQNYSQASSYLAETYKDIELLRSNEEPEKVLHKIFKKYTIASQQGFVF